MNNKEPCPEFTVDSNWQAVECCREKGHEGMCRSKNGWFGWLPEYTKRLNS